VASNYVLIVGKDRAGIGAVSNSVDQLLWGAPVKRAPTVTPAPKVEPLKIKPAKVVEIKLTITAPPLDQGRVEKATYKAHTGINTCETLIKVRPVLTF
jgi:hypothetical protein